MKANFLYAKSKLKNLKKKKCKINRWKSKEEKILACEKQNDNLSNDIINEKMQAKNEIQRLESAISEMKENQKTSEQKLNEQLFSSSSKNQELLVRIEKLENDKASIT